METEKEVTTVRNSTYTIPEIMIIMNISAAAAYHLVQSDDVPFRTMKVGKSWRISKNSFDRWWNQ